MTYLTTLKKLLLHSDKGRIGTLANLANVLTNITLCYSKIDRE